MVIMKLWNFSQMKFFAEGELRPGQAEPWFRGPNDLESLEVSGILPETQKHGVIDVYRYII